MTKSELILRVGSAKRLAELAGVTKQAVSTWGEMIPLIRAVKIEQATNGEIKAADIRPDVFNPITTDSSIDCQKQQEGISD